MKAVIEANRYLENAKDILSTKAKKEDGYYQDKKYIKMAGHTAYSGVLVALDAVLPKKKGRKSIEWYKEEVAKLDKKILNQLDTVYEQLHLVMGYDGFGKETFIKEGFKDAEKIIQWVGQRTDNNVQ